MSVFISYTEMEKTSKLIISHTVLVPENQLHIGSLHNLPETGQFMMPVKYPVLFYLSKGEENGKEQNFICVPMGSVDLFSYSWLHKFSSSNEPH